MSGSHHSSTSQTTGPRGMTRWLWIYSVLLLLVVCLAGIGVRSAIRLDSKTWLLDWIYGLLLVFELHPLEGLDHPTNVALALARVLAPLLRDIGIAGAIASLLVFHHQIRDWWVLRCARRHVLFFGWGACARELIKSYKSRGVAALVHSSPDPLVVAFCQENGIHLVSGSLSWNASGRPGNVRLCRRLRCRSASRIFCMDDDDGRNLENAAALANLDFQDVVWCHVGDDSLARGIERVGLLERKGVALFNHNQLLARDCVERIRPLEGLLVQPERFRPVHMVVLGYSGLTRHLIQEMASAGQWAVSGEGRVRITVIDRDIDKLVVPFLAQHPNLEKVAEIDFVDSDLLSRESLELLRRIAADERYRPEFVVTAEETRLAIPLALRIAATPFEHAPRIWIRSCSDDGVARVLSASQEEFHRLKGDASSTGLSDSFECLDRISFFGGGGWEAHRLEDCVHSKGIDSSVPGAPRELAMDYHEEYCRLTCASADAKSSEAPPSWEDLHPSLRASNRSASRHARHKLDAVGVQRDIPDKDEACLRLQQNEEGLAILEHLRWVAERILDGWQYGPEKSISLRVSPYLVPWSELSESIRDYDRASVGTLIRLVRKGLIVGEAAQDRL